MNIKTRFAPSPTGNLHLGNIRTALYSWLFSRKFNGKFLLRIEDTDLTRSSEKSKKNIIKTLKWLNLIWDEGPYYQSKRLEYYNDIIEEMIVKNLAYRCYCSLERLNVLRANQISVGKKPKYDGNCRNISRTFQNRPHVVRFKNPKEGSVVVKDLVRGDIVFCNSELDDFILRRENGIPTYNFCTPIDDNKMDITHVIRGEEHINNTPKQINFLHAIGLKAPEYIHVAPILNQEGKKISKREDKLYGIESYQKKGFLPEAILNYLLRLGWSYGNLEIFSIEDMINYFSLKSIGKSPSMLNQKKMLWMNEYYIKSLPEFYIVQHLKTFSESQKNLLKQKIDLNKVAKLFKNRCQTLLEMIECSLPLFQEKNEFESIIPTYSSKAFLKLLYKFQKKISDLTDWNIISINSIILSLSKKFQIDVKEVYMFLRFVLTGKNQSPKISLVIYEIGKKITISKINYYFQYIYQKMIKK
ncbi:glutamate--tRNA ligase [Candidatus Riesia pediculicola]|uniref:Glutamate--tRNA ligase n=1 Tax=Riesia pediculicola (strain USDA) TaxID=515618 RepID=D4G8S1_RIEPU|nr:glutamate--tRNA ligase [Candidatus Riesia pediculicola]ADD79517.1 glutamyl-tRNA synthetase [Candidatus Riesia pediculicola USDA]ARC53942.1 glutamine--tRNA ligase [Candidatus Riesia pediculicola]QOJ86569.1 glutamate--tRNA ligase [Candidatus Riesia pediculicola]